MRLKLFLFLFFSYVSVISAKADVLNNDISCEQSMLSNSLLCSGTVFLNGSSAMQGVTIFLMNNDTVLDVTKTDDEGFFCFSGDYSGITSFEIYIPNYTVLSVIATQTIPPYFICILE